MNTKKIHVTYAVFAFAFFIVFAIFLGFNIAANFGTTINPDYQVPQFLTSSIGFGIAISICPWIFLGASVLTLMIWMVHTIFSMNMRQIFVSKKSKMNDIKIKPIQPIIADVKSEQVNKK